MSYSITMNHDPLYFRITPVGEASCVRFQWMITEISNIAAGVERPPVLLDGRGSCFDRIDSWDFTVARDFLLQKNDDLAEMKMAFLANPGRDLDVGRKFVDMVKSRSLARIEVFDDEAAALDWLADRDEDR